MVKIDSIKHFSALFFLALMMLFQATNAVSATITAQVSRSQVSIDETFELIFEADGSPDDDPDFTPLEKNLEIFSRSQSQSIKMINGNYSRTTRWNLTVMAKTTGQLTIPAISFGSDHSQATSIQVQEATNLKSTATDKDIFMEVTVEPKSAYVQQQLIFQIRIYRAVNFSDASLSPPQFNDPDIIVEQIADEQTFETQRNGRRYLVTQIDYLAFPQASGTLTLDPITFQARVMQQSRSRFDMFGQAGPTKRTRSKAISIEIKSIPKNAEDPWLPATNLQLSSSWPQASPEFRVGEPVTRTLAIVADGIASAQLPKIYSETPAGFKQYPDQPMLQDRKDGNGVTGIRQEKIALVPTKPGTHILPAIKVSWWNTKTDKMEVARIAEVRIQVLPAINTAPAIEPPKAAVSSQPVHEITSPVVVAEQAPQPKQSNSIYPWLALFFASGWIATAAAWWWLNKQLKSKNSTATKNNISKEKSRRKILAELKDACQENDCTATRTALLAWGQTLWPTTPPKGLSEFALHFDEITAKHILALNQALYGKGKNSWDGTTLWNAIKDYKANYQMNKDNAQKLGSLYLS